MKAVEFSAGRPNGHHLGMGAGVTVAHDLVPAFADNLAIAYHDRTKGAATVIPDAGDGQLHRALEKSHIFVQSHALAIAGRRLKSGPQSPRIVIPGD